MKLFMPKRSTLKTALKQPKLSSHLVKPAAFKASAIKISAPKVGRAVKVKI